MKKKVLITMPNLRGGGAEKVLIDILNKIDYNKFEITLFLIENIGERLVDLNPNVKLKYATNISDNRVIRYIQWKIIYNFLKINPKLFYKTKIKDKYDVEIAFMEGWATKLISYSSNIYSKKIAWVHCDISKKHWTSHMFKDKEEESCYKKFNEIIFVSNYTKQSFEKKFKQIKTLKKVIHNPIIIEDIEIRSNETKVCYNEFTIVSVGRLTKIKGYERLIKVHASLVNLYPHKLIIIGDGNERINLENLIKNLKVENTVELKGFVKNPYPYIKSADLFVSSSISEGYPLVVCESLVLGTPILSTDTIGPREILEEGKYGILCENSEEGIKNSIEQILKDPSQLNNYIIKSKTRKNQFNYEKNINKIEEILY